MDVLDHGHWVLTSILDEPYLRKPPFHPWTLAATAWLLDSREPWVFRLPSILAAAGCATWLAWLGMRWFGRTAGIAAGFTFLWLFPLWSQNRSAEIDGLNTFLAILTWGCLVELALGRPRHVWRWSALATLALAAALLAKGPAALTVVLAGVIAPCLAGAGVRWLLRPAVLAIFPLAAALAGSWIVAVEVITASASRETQQAGIAEVLERFGTLLDPAHMVGVLTMPLVLTLFALPVSLFAGLALLPSARVSMQPQRNRRLDATLWSLGIACTLVVLFLLENPRYGYIILPILCLPAGVALSRFLHGKLSASLAGMLTRVVPVLWITAVVALIAITIQVALLSVPASVTLGVIAVALITITLIRWRTLTPARWLLMATLTLAASSTGYTLLKADQRATLSSANVAPQLAAHLAAPGETVITGRMWNDKPGLFYYAQAQPRQRLNEALEGTPSELSTLYALYPHEAETLEAVYPGRVEVLERVEAERWRYVIVRLLPAASSD